jgi:RNA polymerase sigma-70 factor (ECF subfamily)
LEELCAIYWSPLYWHVRRLGYDATQAQDLTQGFFSRLLEKRALGYVDRERGKFRSFLLASLSHYLANEHDHAQAQKRGGGQTILPIDFRSAESGYSLEPSHDLTAERLFEKRWAMTVLETSLAALQRQYQQAGKSGLFDALAPFIAAQSDSPMYAEIAQRLDMTESAVRMAVSRMRRRYRDNIRAEVGRTLDDSDDVDQEIHNLLNALGR